MNRKVLKVDAPNADATKRHDSHSLSGRCRSCRGLRILRRTKKRIIHHPTRIRAAKAVRDITAEQFGSAVERKQAGGQHEASGLNGRLFHPASTQPPRLRSMKSFKSHCEILMLPGNVVGRSSTANQSASSSSSASVSTLPETYCAVKPNISELGNGHA